MTPEKAFSGDTKQMNFSFIVSDGSPVTGGFNVVPVNYPLATGSIVVTGDPLTFSPSPQTVSLVNNVYKVEYSDRRTSNVWYVTGSDPNAGNNITSGSIITGSLATVLFNFNDSGINPISASRITLTPVNRNVGFSGSLVLGDYLSYAAADFNTNTFTVNLVPQPYHVTFYGLKKNTSFDILPNGNCTASQCIVSTQNVATVITPQNAANYTYTAQAIDAKLNTLATSSGTLLTTGSTYPITASVANDLNPSADITVNSLNIVNPDAGFVTIDNGGNIIASNNIQGGNFQNTNIGGGNDRLCYIDATGNYLPTNIRTDTNNLTCSVQGSSSYANTASVLVNQSASIDTSGNVTLGPNAQLQFNLASGHKAGFITSGFPSVWGQHVHANWQGNIRAMLSSNIDNLSNGGIYAPGRLGLYGVGGADIVANTSTSSAATAFSIKTGATTSGNTYNGGTPMVTVSGNGNVGIGTSSAAALLTVCGTVGQNADYFAIYSNTTSNTKYFAIDKSGNPQLAASNLYLGNNASNGGIYFTNETANNHLTFDKDNGINLTTQGRTDISAKTEFTLNTATTLTSAKLFSLQNNGSEKLGVTANGKVNCNQVSATSDITFANAYSSLNSDGGITLAGGNTTVDTYGNINTNGQIVAGNQITAAAVVSYGNVIANGDVSGNNGSFMGTVNANGVSIGGATIDNTGNGYLNSLYVAGGVTVTGTTTLDAGNIITDSYGNLTVVAVTGDGSGLTNLTAGNIIGTVPSSSYALTASYALNGGNGGTTTNYGPYSTINTSSAQWVTCSFATASQTVVLNVGALYNFTCSNLPSAGQCADTILFVDNNAATTSSLSFPAWQNYSGGWPAQLTASKNAVIWLRAYGDGQIMGTYAIQN